MGPGDQEHSWDPGGLQTQQGFCGSRPRQALPPCTVKSDPQPVRCAFFRAPPHPCRYAEQPRPPKA